MTEKLLVAVAANLHAAGLLMPLVQAQVDKTHHATIERLWANLANSQHLVAELHLRVLGESLADNMKKQAAEKIDDDE